MRMTVAHMVRVRKSEMLNGEFWILSLRLRIWFSLMVEVERVPWCHMGLIRNVRGRFMVTILVIIIHRYRYRFFSRLYRVFSRLTHCKCYFTRPRSLVPCFERYLAGQCNQSNTFQYSGDGFGWCTGSTRPCSVCKLLHHCVA